ncbi:M20 family metallopeptidase [Mesorhizobium sp. Cs1299R1N1]|uniref:M20 aminoacylase family protein n=1 Tax=Mesorhizobium sp. Cs1299R1N1 TaxID=3015172 RepID=UPI00301DA07D
MKPGDAVVRPTEKVTASARQWRREFHSRPELLFDVPQTAARVADHLERFGCDRVTTGIGRSGVVGVVEGRRGPGPVIGIRADMDALPITEATGLPYASTHSGRMHACGHDGHMAILLGAVCHLASTRAFSGCLVAIFQPAEEGGAGAKVMVDDGLIEKFEVEEVYALHNMPGMDVGTFAISDGAMLAASDRFDIRIIGKGGHAARPHETIDPVIVGSHLVAMMQSVVSGEAEPTDPAVLSITSMHAGEAYNVISGELALRGTARTLSVANRDLLESRVRSMPPAVAQAFGAEAEVIYQRGYPPTINHARKARKLGDAAARVVGEMAVERSFKPIMGAEDFSYMLQASPGAFIFMGNGATAALHHPAYNFNDEALAYGISLWIELVTRSNG